MNRTAACMSLRHGPIALACAVMLVMLGARAAGAADEAALWAALKRGEAFAMMRHALAPGFGDPDHFRLDDCATQRNLSDEGRAQARALGDRFRAQGIATARVMSSAWCRCRETAELLGLGRVETLSQLNSFFQEHERRKPQTEILRAWLASTPLTPPLVLVTHQVNISALAGQGTQSAEVVVIARKPDGSLDVLGSLPN